MNELTFAGGVTCLYMALAMWAAQPSYACVMGEQVPKRLYLDLQVHREHLTRDARHIQRLAWRHAAHAASPEKEAQVAALCLDDLARQLASAHHVTIDNVRRLIDQTSLR
jgi:hypothetical protein